MVIGSWAVVCAALLGLFSTWGCQRLGLTERLPERSNISFFLYQAYEKPHFVLAGLFGVGALLTARRSRKPDLADSAGEPWFSISSRWVVLLLAMAVTLLAAAGESKWLKNYPFAMDEYAPTFQAEIFARGQASASLPEMWRPFGFALSPIFVLLDRQKGTWSEAYFPVYAAIRSLFLLGGIERWTNPVLAGLTVLVLGAVGRLLWPVPRGFFLAPVFLLVSSPQFLINSMTAYSMPAHLLFNLMWLWLWLREDRLGRVVAPWVGVLALGLHNPFPHLLFVLPFVLRILFRQRWRLFLYLSAVYAAGTLLWWFLLQRLHPLLTGSGMLAQFSFPVGADDWLLQLMHATLLFSWLTPVAILLFVAGIAAWRRLPEAGQDLALGVLVTFAFYMLYPRGQGHGWGYRYLYGVLGNVVLVGAYGLRALANLELRRRGLLLGASAVLSLFVSLPLRGGEAREVMAPFVRASRYIASLKGQIVLVDVRTGWYVQDLVRNDPFLRNDPKVMFSDRAVPKRPQLEEAFPGRLHELSVSELAGLGFPGAVVRERRRRP